jgi:hypothetical protein
VTAKVIVCSAWLGEIVFGKIEAFIRVVRGLKFCIMMASPRHFRLSVASFGLYFFAAPAAHLDNRS